MFCQPNEIAQLDANIDKNTFRFGRIRPTKCTTTFTFKLGLSPNGFGQSCLRAKLNNPKFVLVVCLILSVLVRVSLV